MTMIIGLGTDIVNIERMKRLLTRFGSRMKNRLFSLDECHFCEKRPHNEQAYAKMFAAKEACSKALGTGIWNFGVKWRDIRVEHTSSGQPSLSLEGRARLHLDAITPEGYHPHLHLSLTDDAPFASATVIASCRKIALSKEKTL